jgi:uncharacterized protein YggE
LLAAGAASLAAPPQAADAATVSGQGTVVIERPAQMLRMTIELSAKHKQAAEAVAKLKTLKDAATAKLTELGAAKDSVKFAEPALSSLGVSDEAQMQRMVYMGMRGNKPDEKKLKDLPISVTVRLTAEWPLEGETTEDRLLVSHQLQEKIKTAELSGRQSEEAMTPEEEELAEEMAEMSSYGQTTKPGEPTFVFVTRISDEEQSKAMAEAFAKARTQAERLAKAAGQSLGKLRSLSGSAAPGQSEGQDYQYMRYMASMLGQSFSGPPGESEAVGPQPGKVQYHVMVSAAFDLAVP